jgi:hypothetical protein
MSRKIQDIDLGNIAFSKQKVNSQNKFIYVYSEKKPIILKLPQTRLPFGLQKDTLSKKNQYIVDFSMEENPGTLEGFENFDNAIIAKVHKDFFSDKTEEQVRSMYTSCLKYPENKRYSPTLRSKIIIGDDNVPKCDFYESEKNDEGKYPKIDVVSKGNEDYLLKVAGKSVTVESIIECIGLWFFGEKFGLSYKVTQMLLYPLVVEEPEQDCQFIDSDTDTTNSDIDFLGE